MSRKLGSFSYMQVVCDPETSSGPYYIHVNELSGLENMFKT